MENKTIRIILSSVMIYLITRKLYSVLSQIILILAVELKISDKFLHITFHLIISGIVLSCLFTLYNNILKNKLPSIKTVFILLSISVLLSLMIILGNYLLGSYASNLQLSYTEYLSIYGSLDSLEMFFSGIFPLVALVFFLWKLYSDKKIANWN